MKTIFFSLVFLPFTIFAQNSSEKKIYLDSLKNVTTEGSHKYYRITEFYETQKQLYKIKDYYKSGVLQMETTKKRGTEGTVEGEYVSYYENGKIKSIENYHKNKHLGNFEEWYENGTKKSELEYLESKEQPNNNYKIYQYWNPEGKQIVVDGNGNYEEKTETQYDSGKIKNGFKEGIWTGEWTGEFKTKCKYTEEYKEGIMISGRSTDGNNNEYQYDVLEIKPKPKDGINDFYEYIAKKFKIPKKFIGYGIDVKIITTFTINKNGKIVDPKTIQSYDPILDQKAIELITNYEKWIPGKRRGQYVDAAFAIPILLRL